MQGRTFLCVVLGAIVACVLSTGISEAGLILEGVSDPATIEGKEVSAKVIFEIIGGDLQIILQNTGTRADYTPAQVLTDISFNLATGAGFDFLVGAGTSSSVWAPVGSVLHYPKNGSAPGPIDVSSEWGLARNTTLLPADGDTDPLGPFDFSVTATSFDGQTNFAAGNLDGNDGLNGVGFGLINPNAAVKDPPLKNSYLIVDTVVITLDATRALADADLAAIQLPTFSYGSDHTGIRGVPDDVIPEPSSLIVWSLLGALGIALSLRRRR